MSEAQDFSLVKTPSKICRVCGVDKPLGFYHNNKASRDGKVNMCKACTSLKRKEETINRQKDPNRVISCSKCKTKKHVELFKGSPTKSGLYKICKNCRNFKKNISEKVCNLCNILLPVDKFAKSLTNRDGYSNQCKVCQSEYFQEYYRKNRAKKYAYDRKRYLEKKEEILRKNREYYKKNRKRMSLVRRSWALKNPDKIRRQSSEKRARKRNSIPPWLNKNHKYQIELMHLLAKALERDTRVRYHVDHIIPLKHKNMCGLHVPWNLRVIPEEENMRKNNKFIPELGLTAC